MSTLNHYGRDDLILEPGYEVQMDKLGLLTGTVLYQCPAGRELDLMPAIYSAHPDFDIMLLERARFRRAPGFSRIECEYAGAILPGQHEYELGWSTGEEPIQTHPNFSNADAAKGLAYQGGVPTGPVGDAKWLNGAVFEQTAGGFWKFLDFSRADPSAADSLYGVESYLDPSQITWRHSYLAKVPPADASKVGTIDTPDGTPPSLGTGRNWLYLSLEWTRRGYVYQITKTWRASGKRGWNSKIYAPPA